MVTDQRQPWRRSRHGRWVAPGWPPLVGLAGLLVAAALVPSCSEPCCTTDSFPINLIPLESPVSGGGGLVAEARYPSGDQNGAGPFTMTIDTGASLTFFRRRNEGSQMVLRNFDILDAQPPATIKDDVLRGMFRGIEVLPLDLDPARPEAILGGSFLQNFVIELDFAKPAMTFWSRQGAEDGFLTTAGFAVIHFDLFGGAELTARTRPDFLGLTGPVEVPATRIVLRGCGAPAAFDPDAAEPELCCQRGDEMARATGADLALLVATGIGPLVLTQSAWNRVTAAQSTPLPEPAPGPPLQLPTLSAPLGDVLWSTLPRLALVDQEIDDANDPGACVELGRARRLEWVEHHQPEPDTKCGASCTGACPQLCDTDVRAAGKAQNAAAYIEFGDGIPVAIVPDGTPLLQGLRAEIRPEGPELDGMIGAGVLARSRLELDYRSDEKRALFSCAKDAARTACWTSPRCQRLSNPGDRRSCFGRPTRSLPAMCLPLGCG
jgi:hypothetical protein